MANVYHADLTGADLHNPKAHTTSHEAGDSDAIGGDSIIKGWIQFNGTGTIAIQDHYNVSSITDTDVGRYVVTWDTDFANDDYSCIASANIYMAYALDFTIGDIDIRAFSAIGTYVDTPIICAMAFGDQ